MKRPRPSNAGSVRPRRLLPLSLVLVLLAGCSSEQIVFRYPGEEVDLQYRYLKTPALFIDTVTDLRPPLQREGAGHFFVIDYPKDAAWEKPATEIYAEALAQDLEETQLVELVPLRGQADYVLSVDLLSLGCRFERSKASFLLPAALGAGVGLAAGEDGSHRTKLGIALGLAAIVAVPMPSHNRAEAEVRMVLKDRSGNILWETSCLGEYRDKVYATATSRMDQKLVDRFLTRAVKRANACLVGQLRQAMMDLGGGAG